LRDGDRRHFRSRWGGRLLLAVAAGQQKPAEKGYQDRVVFP